MNYRRRRDIDDLDDSLFTREETIRLRQERADMVRAGEERVRQEAIADAAVKARVVAFLQETTREMILRDYAARGLTPRPGTLVSVPMLLRMGWQIAEHPDGGPVLVAPPTPEKYVATGECT